MLGIFGIIVFSIPTLEQKVRGLTMSTQWLSVEDIANELSIHPDTVRGWIRAKQLKAFKFGRDYRVKREDYDKFVEEHATISDDEE